MTTSSGFRHLLRTLPSNLVRVFVGRNALWQVTAIALTAVIVLSGFDWFYFEHTRGIPSAAYLPAVIAGGLVPMIAPPALVAIGAVRRSGATTALGFTLAQAAVLALVVTSAYKAVTGRVQPTLDGAAEIDTSRDFNFGFLEHGVFWGWPSGHTTTAFAMVIALLALKPRSRLVTFVALAYAFYIGLSISVSIHWFSEFVAGAIFGSVIGVVVGQAFRTPARLLPGQESPQALRRCATSCRGPALNTNHEESRPVPGPTGRARAWLPGQESNLRR